MHRIIVNSFCVLILSQSLAGQTAQLLDVAQAMAVELGPPGALASAAIATTAIICEAAHNYATHISKKPDNQQPVHTTLDTLGLETGFVATAPHSSAPTVRQAQIVQTLSPTTTTTFSPSKIFVPENTQILDALHDTTYQRTSVHDRVTSQPATSPLFIACPSKLAKPAMSAVALCGVWKGVDKRSRKSMDSNISPALTQEKKLDFSLNPQAVSQKTVSQKQEYIVPQATPVPQQSPKELVITADSNPSTGRITGQEYQRIESIKNWFHKATSTMPINLGSYGNAFKKARNYYLKNHPLPNITNEYEWQNFGPVLKKYFTRYVLEEHGIEERPGKGFLSKLAKLFSKKHKTKLAHKQTAYNEHRNAVLEDPYRLFDVVWVWTNPYMPQQKKESILSQMEDAYAQKQVHLLQEIIAALPQSVQEELDCLKRPVGCGDTGDTAKTKQIHGCGSTAIAGMQFDIRAIHDMLEKNIVPSDVARIIKYDQPIQEIDRSTLIYCNQKEDIAFAFNKNAKTVMHVGHYSDMMMLNSSESEKNIKAPGIPSKEDGFEPPKNWDGKKVRHPKNGKIGWPDSEGNVWVPTGEGPMAHGGPHWDVQSKDGRSYRNVMPGGHLRGQQRKRDK